MSKMTIKNVPECLHKTPKKAAEEEGRSLNSFILRALKEAPRERKRRKQLQTGWEQYDEFVRTLPYPGDSTPLLREDRNR